MKCYQGRREILVDAPTNQPRSAPRVFFNSFYNFSIDRYSETQITDAERTGQHKSQHDYP